MTDLWLALQEGNRIYTLKKVTATGGITKSAHPGEIHKGAPSNASADRLMAFLSAFSARFSPDDKFSRHRVTIKKRFGLLPTQMPAKPM